MIPKLSPPSISSPSWRARSRKVTWLWMPRSLRRTAPTSTGCSTVSPSRPPACAGSSPALRATHPSSAGGRREEPLAQPYHCRADRPGLCTPSTSWSAARTGARHATAAAFVGFDARFLSDRIRRDLHARLCRQRRARPPRPAPRADPHARSPRSWRSDAGAGRRHPDHRQPQPAQPQRREVEHLVRRRGYRRHLRPDRRAGARAGSDGGRRDPVRGRCRRPDRGDRRQGHLRPRVPAPTFSDEDLGPLRGAIEHGARLPLRRPPRRRRHRHAPLPGRPAARDETGAARSSC